MLGTWFQEQNTLYYIHTEAGDARDMIPYPKQDYKILYTFAYRGWGCWGHGFTSKTPFIILMQKLGMLGT